MKLRQTLCFDDVLLEPKFSTIESRGQISLEAKLGQHKFKAPIISSPMDTVTESSMSISMAKHGGLGVVHRYNTIKEQCEIVLSIRDYYDQTANNNIGNIAAAVGVAGDLKERAKFLFDSGVRVFCVDIAHGHHTLMESALKYLRDKFENKISIIAGNVATPGGYLALSDWGADAVRIGIGGGSICSTRIQTGHGIPTFQSVIDCRDHPGAAIIADGGIKSSGDIVKALAAGADFVMLGSMLAGTAETPGQVFQNNEGKRYKVYRGMASPEAQIAWRGNARSLEGISTTIPYRGDVEKIITDVLQNVKSGLSYSGARNIRELQAKSSFIQQSTSGLHESKTHILLR